MGSRTDADHGREVSEEERAEALGWIVKGWAAALLAGGGSAVALLWLRDRTPGEVLEVVGVFSTTLLAAVTIVLTAATASWVRNRER